jgi:hypothetical protein
VETIKIELLPLMTCINCEEIETLSTIWTTNLIGVGNQNCFHETIKKAGEILNSYGINEIIFLGIKAS